MSLPMLMVRQPPDAIEAGCAGCSITALGPGLSFSREHVRRWLPALGPAAASASLICGMSAPLLKPAAVG